MFSPDSPFVVCWFRRDLRLEDQTAFAHALATGLPVLPVFVFDRHILDKLPNKRDRRLVFIHQILQEMHEKLRAAGSGFWFWYGTPEEAFQVLAKSGGLKAVYTNHDYEPYALERDGQIGSMLEKAGVAFHTSKDQVVFEKDEILTGNGLPYTVFTPYSKKWKDQLRPEHLREQDCRSWPEKVLRFAAKPIPTLEEMGFEPVADAFPARSVSDQLLREYGENRNYPAKPATSRLGVHLRFGTLSIRALVKKAQGLSESWLNELIWREFYMMILWSFPQVGQGKAFKEAYDCIPWRNNEKEFEAWCAGKTGYPIVDAGMRELKETGFMHNRVRMIVASFLVKHLLIDWRKGERWFAEHLLDFELASNNGGWQWAAGSGCDAAPYFRVFNPKLQTEKFDPKFDYIRQWVPEYNQLSYTLNPIVQHEFARKRVLDVFKAALNS